MRLTFELPEGLWADQINLVGDFNGWNVNTHMLRRDQRGNWSLSLDLPIGRAYQFRYLFDNGQWSNDSDADCYFHSSDGYHNFVVVTDLNFKRQLETTHSRNGTGAILPMLDLSPSVPPVNERAA
jgi:1,4-alpha-glucan branching enzyme